MNLTHKILNTAHQLAIDIANRKTSLQQATATLYDAVQQASAGDAQVAEELVSTLCSQAESFFDEWSPLALACGMLTLRVSEEFGDPFYCGRATHTLGKTLRKLGRFEDAKKAFTASLDYFGETYPVHASVAAGDLGNALFSLGEYDEAERLLRYALEVALQLDDIHNQLEWKLALGNTLVFTSKNDEALAILEDGLAQARDARKDSHEGKFLTGIANVYENVGRFDDCIAHHKAALVITRRIGSKADEIQDLLNLGNLEQRFNRFETALEFYEQAVDLAVELNHIPLQAQLTGNIAGVYIAQDRVHEAITLLKDSVRLCREHGVKYALLRNLGNLGGAYRLIGDHEKARACYEESAELSRATKDLRSLAVDLRNLASIYEDLADVEKGLKCAEEALVIGEQLKDPDYISRSEQTVASLLEKIPERRHEVWQHYQRAMEAAETFRRHVHADRDRVDLYSSRHSGLYEKAVSWLLSNGDVQHAFEISERFKSRLLLDVIAERATGKLSEPESAQQLLERARTVGPKTSIASYFMSTDETIVFFVAPGGAAVEHRGVPFGLNAYLEWFDRWSNLLPESANYKSTPLSLVQSALEELDTLLVRPLRELLKQHPQTKRLILVPHRFLHSAPLHAARDPSTGRYLAEDFVVTYLPALRLLKTAGPEHSHANPTLLAVGDPSTTLSALPAALAEAQAVAKLFGSEVLSGADATVEAFTERTARANIIHLACHCKFDPQDPGRSYLLMAGNEHLTAEAISALHLQNVDLVSMAACESGRARPGGVDESLGLTRSWLMSDVRFVLGAQWKVEDKTSKLFMLDFYKRVKEGANSPDAYAAAQRSLINGQAPANDPRFWAPFILTGCA